MPRELFSPWIYFTLRNPFMLLRIKNQKHGLHPSAAGYNKESDKGREKIRFKISDPGKAGWQRYILNVFNDRGKEMDST